MDDHTRCLRLFLVLALFCLHSRAESETIAAGSVLFLDSPTNQYLRPHDISSQSDPLSATEVGAVVSVLLGFAPPATLSAASSTKLNGLLMPNPFDRPRHVLVVKVGVSEGFPILDGDDGSIFKKAIKSKVFWGSDDVQIELPDEDKITILSLDESDDDSHADITSRDINDFASWLGGSCTGADVDSLDGELTILLPSGLKTSLHMSKNADQEFISNLISLVRKARRAMETDSHIFGRTYDVAELLTARFDAFKAVEEYGSRNIVQQRQELFLATISNIFASLQTGLNDQVVGVILFSQAHTSEPEKMLDIYFTSQPSRRWLEDAETPSNSTVAAEVALVRRTLAWTVGIILLISAAIGVYLLMNMPLTRDTLLYSNVKLD